MNTFQTILLLGGAFGTIVILAWQGLRNGGVTEPKPLPVKTNTRDWWDNPLVFILAVICWPATVTLVLAWLVGSFFKDGTENWTKGGRFTENEMTIGPVPRYKCMDCGIIHTGPCPKCGKYPPGRDAGNVYELDMGAMFGVTEYDRYPTQ